MAIPWKLPFFFKYIEIIILILSNIKTEDLSQCIHFTKSLTDQTSWKLVRLRCQFERYGRFHMEWHIVEWVVQISVEHCSFGDKPISGKKVALTSIFLSKYIFICIAGTRHDMNQFIRQISHDNGIVLT